MAGAELATLSSRVDVSWPEMLPPQELDVQNKRGFALCDHARVLGRARIHRPCQTSVEDKGSKVAPLMSTMTSLTCTGQQLLCLAKT